MQSFLRIFPSWEQHIPMLGTEHSQAGNSYLLGPSAVLLLASGMAESDLET